MHQACSLYVPLVIYIQSDAAIDVLMTTQQVTLMALARTTRKNDELVDILNRERSARRT